MEQIYGTGAMVLGAALSGAALMLLALALQGRLGWLSALSIAGLGWAVVVIGLVTLVPLDAIDLEIPAEARQQTCSTDYGGPAPDGFWIFSGTQRTLNTVLFVPAGALLVLATARWKAAFVLVPLGLAALAAYSVGIELTQLALARIGRQCDVTDVVDNVTGAGTGVIIGVLLAGIVQPWRRRGPHH